MHKSLALFLCSALAFKFSSNHLELKSLNAIGGATVTSATSSDSVLFLTSCTFFTHRIADCAICQCICFMLQYIILVFVLFAWCLRPHLSSPSPVDLSSPSPAPTFQHLLGQLFLPMTLTLQLFLFHFSLTPFSLYFALFGFS